MWGRESGHLLEGGQGPAFLAEGEPYGLQEVPEFVGLPLGVVDPGDSLVVNSDEVIRRVAGDSPGVGTTSENLGLGCCCVHMCDS